MRSALIYAVLGGLGIVGSLQGCSCKSDDNDASPDASVPLDGGPATSADAAACLDQDPPAGFSVVSSGEGKLGNYGEHVAMTLDDKGSPLVAFVHGTPNGDTASAAASILYFTRWDRCTATWTTPVNVDVVGAISDGAPVREVAIARDATSGAIGLAFAHEVVPMNEDPFSEVWFASSTDQGATWTKAVVSEVPAGKEGSTHTAGGPGLAMNAGKISLGYWQENTFCADQSDTCNGWYVEGTPAAWTRTPLPNLSGGFGASLATPVSVQLDSAGKPAAAYIVAPSTGYDTQIAFWRPGTPTAVKVTDSKNIQNDAPVLAMVFEGDKPRIATILRTVDGAGADLSFLRSNDGTTWDAPIALPHDGADASEFYASLALGPNGSFAVASRLNAGTGDAVCGAPKISRSTDDGATWTTCGADTTKALTGVGGPYVSAAFLPSGKLSVSFMVTPNEGDPIKAGVAIWREP